MLVYAEQDLVSQNPYSISKTDQKKYALSFGVKNILLRLSQGNETTAKNDREAINRLINKLKNSSRFK
jgi:hypothetical protein